MRDKRHLIMKLNNEIQILSRSNIVTLLLVLLQYVTANTDEMGDDNKKTLCSSSAASANNTSLKMYINCTVSIDYSGPSTVIRCNSNTGEVGNIVVLIYRDNSQDMRLFSLDCVSGAPMNVSVVVGKHFKDVDVSQFPLISQKRIVGNYHNKTSYKYQLHVPLLKFYHSVPITWRHRLIKYQIVSTDTIIKTNVVIMFVDRDVKGGCPQLVPWETVGLDTLLLQKTFEIPVLTADNLTTNLYLEMCNYKVLNTDSDFLPCSSEELPPSICLSSISELKEKYSNVYKISLRTILDTLNIKSDMIQFFDPFRREEGNLRKPKGNKSKRPLVVLNYYYTQSELKDNLELLQLNSNSSCVQPETFSFDQIMYILQLFGSKEVVVGGQEDISFNPFRVFKISSKLLLKYGPGVYSFGDPYCTVLGLLRTNYFVVDFKSRPKSRDIALWPPKYDIFTGAIKTNNLILSCASKNITINARQEYYKHVPNGDDIFLGNSSTTVLHSKSGIPGLTHGYRAAAVLLYAPELPEETTHTVLSCDSLENDKWWIQHINYTARPFEYFPKPDVIACTFDSGVKEMKHWMCKNRFQCQITTSLCTPDIKLGIDERICMETLTLVRTIPCSEFSGDAWDEKTDMQKRFRCTISQPASMGVIQWTTYSIPGIASPSVRYIYFRGFDNVLYWEFEMKGLPPKNATLKLTSTASHNIFYTNGNYTFQCEAHSFYYDDGIQWFLKFTNGSILQPPHERTTDPQDSEGDVLNSKSELNLLFLGKSLKEVICSAPLANSHNWNNISLPITIIESTLPEITSSDSDVRFTEGSKNQGITCTAKGVPRPNIKWTLPNSVMEKNVLILDNTLLIPIYNSSFSGEYICTASNLAGNSSRSFFIQEKREYRTIYTLVGVVLAFVLFFAVLFLLYLMNERIKKFREMREIIKLLNGSKSQEGQIDENGGTEANAAYLLFDTNYEIKTNSFIIDRNCLIGKGEFGEVYKGLLEGINKTVAFKTVRSNGGMGPLKALVSEAKILMYIGPHEHLVTLMGVYRQEINSGILYVAIEFCEIGSLKSFLTENSRLFTEDPILEEEGADTKISVYEDPFGSQNSLCNTKSLLMWSGQIANAMEYLGTKNVIHSDLATRNVLLTSEGNAKVTDFGLSRRTYNYTEYIKTAKDPLPWRWLAIESLRTNTFSAKSDVWAYGITLWEIFSLGDCPYPGMDYNMEFVQELKEGLRNFKPKRASDEIYNVMELCWDLDPENRPKFSSMKMIFEYAVSNGMSGLKNKVSQGANLEEVALQLASSVYLQL